MGFVIEASDLSKGSVKVFPYTSMNSVPGRVRELLEGGADYAVLRYEGREEAAVFSSDGVPVKNPGFDGELTRLWKAFSRSEYRRITGSVGREQKNPRYYHIPGVEDSAISLFIDNESLTVRKVCVEEAIGAMEDQNVAANEKQNDKCGLRGISVYDARAGAMKQG